MASPPDPREQAETLTRQELAELKRNLLLLSPSSVLKFYSEVHRACAPERKPGARAIQQLVTAWKILRSWDWH